MKTKTFFKSALAVLLLGASVSAMAEYVRKPELCNGVTAKWNATARTFTVSNLPAALKEEPFCAWVTDPMWAEGTYDWTITTYNGTFTPGDKTYTTGRLKTSWGDPLKGGTNGASYFSISLKHKDNDFPTGTPRAEDCSKAFIIDVSRPICCKYFNATFSGSTIYFTGILNCSLDNLFVCANPGFTKWAIVPIKVDPANPDHGSADVSELTFYGTSEKVYPYADDVMFFMNSNGITGSLPNDCYKSYPPNRISEVITHSITISPNPATPSETITIKGEYASDAKVSITSVSGAMVGSVTPTVGADAMTVSLSGLNLEAGIYYIRIESGEKVFSGKLCVK
jgi:hypothetical protein